MTGGSLLRGHRKTDVKGAFRALRNEEGGRYVEKADGDGNRQNGALRRGKARI